MYHFATLMICGIKVEEGTNETKMTIQHYYFKSTIFLLNAHVLNFARFTFTELVQVM